VSRPIRVVIVLEADGATTADVIGVETAEDVQRLKRELRDRQVLAEIRQALSEAWDELSARAKEMS
jgi:hypothetical protein